MDRRDAYSAWLDARDQAAVDGTTAPTDTAPSEGAERLESVLWKELGEHAPTRTSAEERDTRIESVLARAAQPVGEPRSGSGSRWPWVVVGSLAAAAAIAFVAIGPATGAAVDEEVGRAEAVAVAADTASSSSAAPVEQPVTAPSDEPAGASETNDAADSGKGTCRGWTPGLRVCGEAEGVLAAADEEIPTIASLESQVTIETTGSAAQSVVVGIVSFTVAGDSRITITPIDHDQLRFEVAQGKMTLADGRAFSSGESVELGASSERPRGPTHSADTWLEMAQRARADGNIRAAARAYEGLIEEHPSAPQARTALVSLGQLQLERMSQPRRALRSFSTYLRQGGPLSEEAAYGRIRALEKLLRADAEAQAIRDFLRRFPASGYAAELHARAEALGKGN